MKGAIFTKENKLAELSMKFYADIINLVKYLKSNHESVVSTRIGRSGSLRNSCPVPDAEITQPHNKQNGNPVSIRIAVFMCL